MAVRKIQPVYGGFASILTLAALWAVPVLAAPDRSICDETAAPGLDITTTDFSVTTDADASIELLGPNFELASRESSVGAEDEPEQAETAAEEDTDGETGDAAAPVEAGPLVNKRQMYRRDI